MKTHLSLLLGLSLASSSFAATDPALHGADADAMANILKSSGFASESDVTVERVNVQNPSCVGLNYADSCQARNADSLPAAPLKAIAPNSAGEFWSLLKKAGFKNESRPDGKTMIHADRIDCVTYSDPENVSSCNVK